MDYCVSPADFPTSFINTAIYAPFQPDRPRISSPERVESPTTAKKGVDFFDADNSSTSLSPGLGQYNTQFFQNGTPDADRSSERILPPISSAAQNGVTEEIDKIAKQRVRLMASRYAGNADSFEMVARLEILNARMLTRLPRVTNDQVDALEAIGNQLAEARAEREERMRRRGVA
jgi:hypothetical protein